MENARLDVTNQAVPPPPVPLRLTLWGLSAALSVSVSAPVRLPLAVGVNVTLMLQLALVATDPAQLLVWAKSPLAAMVSEVSAAVPVLVRVMDCEAPVVETDCPEKVRLDADKLALAPPPPVPRRLTRCGLPLALSASVSAPVRFPSVVGVNVTLVVQLPLAATEPPQLFVWAKSPLALIVRLVKGPLPVLVRVMDCAALVVETDCPAKVRLVGERLTTGANPVPLRVTVCGLLTA